MHVPLFQKPKTSSNLNPGQPFLSQEEEAFPGTKMSTTVHLHVTLSLKSLRNIQPQDVGQTREAPAPCRKRPSEGGCLRPCGAQQITGCLGCLWLREAELH